MRYAFRNIAVFAGVVVVVGCAGTRQLCERPVDSAVKHGNVRITVLRKKQMLGAAVPLKIWDNDLMIGLVGPGGDLCWDRPSGPAKIGGSATLADEPIVLNTEEGHKYSVVIRNSITGFHFHLSAVDRLQSLPAPEMVAQVKPQVRKPVSVPQKKEQVLKSEKPVLYRWALVIGISKYKDKRVPELLYARRDAEAFYQWLVSTDGGNYDKSHVMLLCDEQATAGSIRDALFNWLKQPIAEDLVTIYYAGHGSPESPDNLKNLFLLPYDVNYAKIGSTGFPMWDIETSLNRFIRAKRVIVVADACHAAGVGENFDTALRAGRGLKVNPITNGFSGLSDAGDSVCILSAAAASQFSQEGEKWGGGHGVFTYFLLQGLSGKADSNHDGHVTVGELTPYISEHVRRATKSAQCPRMAGSFDPNLTIGN